MEDLFRRAGFKNAERYWLPRRVFFNDGNSKLAKEFGSMGGFHDYADDGGLG